MQCTYMRNIPTFSTISLVARLISSILAVFFIWSCCHHFCHFARHIRYSFPLVLGPQSVESAVLLKFPVVFASFIPLNPFIPCFCTRCRESGEREIENICSPIYRPYDVRLNDYDSHSCRNSQLRSEQIKESNTNYIPLLWQWIVHIGLAWM